MLPSMREFRFTSPSTTGGRLAPQRIWVVYSSTPSLGAMLARSWTWWLVEQAHLVDQDFPQFEGEFRIALNSASARGSWCHHPPKDVLAMERCLLSKVTHAESQAVRHAWPRPRSGFEPRATWWLSTGPKRPQGVPVGNRRTAAKSSRDPSGLARQYLVH